MSEATTMLNPTRTYMSEYVFNCLKISNGTDPRRLEQPKPERVYQLSENNMASFLNFDTSRLDTLHMLQMLQYRGFASIRNS